MVKKYYAILQKAYKVIANDLRGYGLSKKIILQITINEINDITGPNGLVPLFLIFKAYPHMSK